MPNNVESAFSSTTTARSSYDEPNNVESAFSMSPNNVESPAVPICSTCGCREDTCSCSWYRDDGTTTGTPLDTTTNDDDDDDGPKSDAVFGRFVAPDAGEKTRTRQTPTGPLGDNCRRSDYKGAGVRFADQAFDKLVCDLWHSHLRSMGELAAKLRWGSSYWRVWYDNLSLIHISEPTRPY